MWVTLGFLIGSTNFCKFFWVSWEVCVLHGYDCNHWVAKSCTTTAYRWLFRDSHPSLRTLWSAVIKSPKFFRSWHHCTRAFGSASRYRNFGPSEGACRHCACPKPVPLLLATPLVVHEKNWKCLDIQAHGFTVAPKDHVHRPNCSLNSIGSSIRATHVIDRFVLLRVLLFFCFRFPLVYVSGFPVAPHSYLHFFRVLDFRCIC